MRYLLASGLIATLLATGCRTTTPTAPYEPKYTDAFDMRYGLFIHWVGCSPTQGAGCTAPDGTPYLPGSIDAFANDIDTEAVADEIAQLGFEYVLITDFHGFGTMLHPSEVSDRWRGKGYASERDVIGEMIAALKKRGIGFVLFTHPVAGHTYTDKEELGWNDPTDNYKRYNDFINDIYAELSERYGNEMMGMGFDSEFGLSGNTNFVGKLDLGRLRETILSRAPNLQLYGLAAPNETCDFGHREVYDGSWHSPWKTREADDYESETWPAYLRKTSIVQARHWATIGSAEAGRANLNAAQLYRYSVLQAAAATEGPGNAWAASPYTDGSWEKDVGEVFAEVADIMAPVRASLTRVYPSTSYPTLEGATLASLTNGIVATKSTDDRIEYIHVLNPPDGRELTLPPPADGKRFVSARLLASGQPMELRQEVGRERFPASSMDGKRSRPTGDIELVLADGENWDKLNTVIALVVAPDTIPPHNLALHKKVTASDGRYIPKLGAPIVSARIRLVDGKRHVALKPIAWANDNYGWSSAPRTNITPTWAQVDLGETQAISEVHLYPRDDKGNEGLGFPVDFEIQISTDREAWSTVASKKGMPQSKAMQSISFASAKARYLRVVGTKLRQNPEDKLYSMQFVELEVYE
jgi:hypothetical protein